MSAAAFDELRRTWNVATVQRDARTMKTVGAFALLLTLGIPVVAGVALVREHQVQFLLLLRLLLGIGGFWLAIVWTMVYLPGSVVMNSAANARLLPRQRRRLLQMACAGWLLASAGLAAAFGDWKTFPLVGMYLIGFALMMTGRMAAVLLTILPAFWPMLTRSVFPEPLVRLLASDATPLAATVVLLCAVGWAMTRLYPAGGDRHLKHWTEQSGRLRRIETQGWSGSQGTRGIAAAPGLRAYAAILRRDCRAPRPTPMLMHALGPGAHWTVWIAAVAILLAASIGLYILFSVRGDDFGRGFLSGFSWSGLAGLSLMVAFSTAQFRQHLGKTRGEQALLRLTPLAGDTALLNRRLAAGMLATALMQWLALSGALLVLASMFGHDAVLRQLAVCCLCGQAALAVLFGDFARRPTVGLARGLAILMLAVLELAAALVLGWLSGDPLTATWAWLAAISVAGGAIQLRHGWRAMVAAPVAFPAGRLG
jgi:hypothetical protein